MENANFKVIFLGVADGQDENDVRQKLAEMFKTTPDRVERFFSGRREVVKEGLTEEKANKYKAALERAGGKVLVESMDSGDGDDLVLEMETPEEHAPEVPEMNCPKCGATQPRSEKCVKCGVVFAEYYKKQAEEEAEAEAATKRPEGAPPLTPEEEKYKDLVIHYVPPKKTWWKTVIKLVILLAILGGGYYVYSTQIREHDESPPPNPGAVAADLIPRRVERIFNRGERNLNGPWPTRYYFVTQEGSPYPVTEKFPLLFRWQNLAVSAEGARTLVILKTDRDDYNLPLGAVLVDALFVDIGDPAKTGLATAVSEPRSDAHPNGYTYILKDDLGRTEESEETLDTTGLILKLCKEGLRK